MLLISAAACGAIALSLLGLICYANRRKRNRLHPEHKHKHCGCDR